MLSPPQWSGSMKLLQLASLCLHGTYLNYMTDCHSVLCWSVVNSVTGSACKPIELLAIAERCDFGRGLIIFGRGLKIFRAHFARA